MSIMNNKTDSTVKRNILSVELVLSLLFPQYSLMIMPSVLVLTKENEGKKEQCLINNDNFEQFKSIIQQMFCLKTLKSQDYNPANKLAQQIANKFRNRRKMLEKKTSDEEHKPLSILQRYISILVLANHHTYSELMQYTVYQLFDQFRRFEKKYSYDIWLKAKLAGAQNLEDVDSWLNDQEIKTSNTRPSSNRIQYK